MEGQFCAKHIQTALQGIGQCTGTLSAGYLGDFIRIYTCIYISITATAKRQLLEPQQFNGLSGTVDCTVKYILQVRNQKCEIQITDAIDGT